jgi:hypothetical protein
MSFGNFLKKAAPIAAGIIGGPAAGAIVGGGIGMWEARNQAKAQERAAQQAGTTAMAGHNYLAGSPIGQQYLPAGGAAMDQQSALLGLGGDPAAAQEAFRRYQESTGFQGQMQAMQQGVMGSAAGRGLLGSGSTMRALQRHGQQLGQQSFGNYLGQLGGVAGMGLQAGGMLGQTAQAGGMQAAQMQYGGGMAAADSRSRGWDQFLGGLGGAYDAWNTGRNAGGGGGGGGGGVAMPDPAYRGMA